MGVYLLHHATKKMLPIITDYSNGLQIINLQPMSFNITTCKSGLKVRRNVYGRQTDGSTL